MKAFLLFALTSLSCPYFALAERRTTPPSGAVVVRAGTNSTEEFATVSAAVASLPNDNSTQTIFIYPGIYAEQVYITREGPLTAGVNSTAAGSDDASGTLRIHKDDFNITGVVLGSMVVAYGYQDTLYANEGTQVYLKNYIELFDFQGAVDFIFGRHALAFFGGNTIAVAGPGCITANGRESDDDGSYVLDKNEIILAPGAVNGTAGNIFFGRPWGAFAKVIFKNTLVTVPMNDTLWSIWNVGDPNTSNVTFADYHTVGFGIWEAERPDFVTELTESEAAMYNMSSAVGSDWATWVDVSYL
ncbi:hypothetical protein H0H92_013618 [Tricholoma furcatifolium]|nr:hypothetical protein H0H92_013618 [Tricholoma furcatifolium]